MSAAEKLVPSQEPLTEAQRLAAAIDRYYANISRLTLEYVPVNLDLIILHKIPDVALFLPQAGTQPVQYSPFRGKGMYVSQAELDTLAANGLTELYIQRVDVPVFTQYVESVLGELDTISPMADDQKVGLLRSSAIHVMGDIFNAPTPENIQRGVKAVSGFVYVLMRDPKAYQLLLSLSSHDHYTLQHSVGVATTAIILAKKFGVNDEASLIEAGVGGLLHDIGKTSVPKEIINKKGPLDETEWALMNYPMGLRGEQISLYAKIVTLCDIYNAITTDRSYSQAKPPFEAFKLIKDKLSHKIDLKLYEALVQIYGGKTT
ncbi:MAG: HD domain-containing protein [Deltaproteobacteria bacterium]|nr:HD domain-containing protein [Deltaproteobacteria bacterium]